MSYDRKSLRILDARIARESQLVDLISEGPSSVTYQTITTPDQDSKSPQFVIQSPSPLTGINRTMRLHVVGTITLQGTHLELFLADHSRIALRQYALQAIMQSMNVQLNDFSTQLGNINLVISGLAAVSNGSEAMAGSGSTYGAIPDVYAEYSSAAGVAGGLFSTQGQAPYGDSLVSGRVDGLTSFTPVPAIAATTLAIGFDFSEDFIVSPFNYANREQKYIFGISNMTISCTYANFHRLLSLEIPALSTLTGPATLAFTNQQLECSFVTPDDSSLIQRPLKHVYDWSQVQSWYTTNGSTFVPGQDIPISSNSIELPVVPSKLIVYCTYSNTDMQDPQKCLADVCFALKNCNVQFGTRAGLLSGATPINLWEVSRRAGSHAKYPIWAGKRAVTSASATGAYAGSPLIIDVAADLSLPHGAQPVTPGMSTRIQFSINAVFNNQSAANVTAPKLVVIALTPGFISIKDGATIGQLGGVTLEAARDAPVAPLMQADTLDRLSHSEGLSGGGKMTGAGFFDDLGSALSNAVTGTISAAPLMAMHLLGAGAPRGGAATGGASVGGAAMGGAAMGGSLTARKLLGGRLMDARQMARQ